MSKTFSATYDQNTKKKASKKACERYQHFSEEKKRRKESI